MILMLGELTSPPCRDGSFTALHETKIVSIISPPVEEGVSIVI